MSSAVFNFTNEECILWKNNPNCNPRTNRIIQTNGRVYNSIKDICGDPNVTPDPPSAWRNGLCTSTNQNTVVPPSPVPPSPLPPSPVRPIRSTQTSSSSSSEPQQATTEIIRNNVNCERWRSNPNCDPILNTYIYTNRTTYNNLKRRCGRPHVLPDHLRYEHPTNACHPPNVGMTQQQINSRQTLIELERLLPREPAPLVISSSRSNTLSNKKSSTIKTDEDIKFTCKEKYSNFNNKYKRLSNKLIRMCNMYSNKCAIADINKVKDEINKKKINSHEFITLVININNSKIAEFFYMYKMLEQTNINIYKNFFRYKLDNFKIRNFHVINGISTYLEGVGIGVTIDFFQGIIDELTSLNIFIKPEGSDRYFLNPYMDVNKIFMNVIKGRLDTISIPLFVNHVIANNEFNYRDFYIFIGNLLSFFIFNDLGFNFRLSTALLAKMIYKIDNINNTDLISYAAFDFPDEFNTNFANLMRGVGPADFDYIQSIDMNFNDVIDIEDPNDYKKILDHQITDSNFINYLELYSKEILNNPLKNDKRSGLIKHINNLYYYDGFIKGFNYMKHHVFKKIKPTIFILDELLYKNISKKDIIKLINKFTAVMIEKIDRLDHVNKGKYNIVFQNIISILNDNGETFPFEEIGIDHRPDDYINYFLQFIEKLIRFWTGFGYINLDLNYQFKIINKTAYKLPQSHMCFAEIDIYTINDVLPTKEELYKLLVISSFGGDPHGVHNY